jgi:hypothetical protein
VGKLVRDMRCTNPVTLRKFFLSLVFSQLYGVIFVRETEVEFERGVGIFFRTAMGLPETFPSVVALGFMGIKHVSMFVLEERSRFFLKLEGKVDSPGFSALVMDRCVLFPNGHGLNSLYGSHLVSCGILRTMDYRHHYQQMSVAIKGGLDAAHLTELLGAD